MTDIKYEKLVRLYEKCFPNRDPHREIEALGTNFEFLIEADSSFFMYRKTALDEAEIIDIGTIPEERLKGHAEKLFEKGIDLLRAEGVKTIYLEVAEDNHAARRVYRKLGLEDYNRRKNYYHSDENGLVDAILMKKDI